MLWNKGIDPANWMTRYTVGEDYRWDTILLPYDILGTRAHAEGLVEIGILSEAELESIQVTLGEMQEAYAAGHIEVRPEDEDCHTVIEAFLTDKIGDVGKKIHTGRSRNDQVLTALRLYLKAELEERIQQLKSLTHHLIDLAEGHRDWLMPGYTHLQRAMPSTVGLWAMGYAELMISDLEALSDAHRQTDTSPLGSAAGYGVPLLSLPREANARRLGFGSLQHNVTATQLSRGKLELHVAHALIQVGATLNRFASDLVMFNMSEFGFVNLPPHLCTGSSIMPQKQNPDVLELTRAYYHRLLAEANVLMTLPANLPSGYHRDLQITKEAVMRAMIVSQDMLAAMIELAPALTFNREKLRQAVTPELYATAAALEKVLAGIPFRDAYREAANEIQQMASINESTVLASYTISGFPGKHEADAIRQKLEAIR